MKHFILFLIGTMYYYSSLSAPFQTGNTITISEPVYHNLYLAGKNVIVNAPVYGDLFITGGSVIINDSITCDLFVAGGKVILNGVVCDDMRCAGGNIQIYGQVGGELIAGGGSVIIEKNAVINEMYASGGEVVINGTITENCITYSGSLLLNGTIQKNAESHGGKITINGHISGNAILSANEALTIGENAYMGGNTRYWYPGKQTKSISLIKPGTAFYDTSLKTDQGQWYYLGLSTLIGLAWYICTVFLMVLIIQYLFERVMKAAGNSLSQSSFKSLLYGLLFYIGAPIAIALSLVTIIGIPAGLIALLLYILVLFLSTVITSVVLAYWLNSRSGGNWSNRKIVLAAFAIFIILKIITFTPIIGWLLIAVIIATALGSILRNIKWRKSDRINTALN